MKKKIFIEGPFLSESGYGYQARFALDAILTREDLFDVHLSPLRWGRTSWLPSDDPKSELVNKYAQKTREAIRQAETTGVPLIFDIHLFIGIPNEVTKKSPHSNIIYTAGIETTKVSHQWISKVNELTGMIVCSNFGKAVFEQTKYGRKDHAGNEMSNLETCVPIKVVNYGIQEKKPQIPKITFPASFNFLTVCQWGPRKNLNNTILGFVDQFQDNPDVGLVVKTMKGNNSYSDRKVTESEMKNMIKNVFPDAKCKVTLIHGNMSDSEILGLYNHDQIKALVNIGHGEGYGLPMFEAAYNALPVITTGWSGESDFLVSDGVPMYQSVDYTMAPVQAEAVWDPVILKDSMWAYADIPDYKKKLQEVFDSYDVFKSLAQDLKNSLEKTHALDDKHREFVEALLEPSKMQDNEIDAWMNEMQLIE